MKKILLILIVLFIGYIFIFGIDIGGGNNSTPIVAEESDVLVRWTIDDGTNVALLKDGGAYEDVGDGSFKFLDTYYDPEYFEKNYVVEDNNIYKKLEEDGSVLLQMRNNFTEDFENVNTIQELTLGEKDLVDKEIVENGVTKYDPNALNTRWNSFALQSPQAPEKSDYVSLRHDIEAGADFRDNRVEPSTEQAHSGSNSIRAYSVPPTRNMVVSKASFATELVHFARGDDFWFSGWFYFEEGTPVTILDLESTWTLGHGGLRILFTKEGNPYIELKAFDKPSWRNADYVVPKNKWVEVKVHFQLDEIDGQVELWIDGVKVVDDRGQTLPLADIVLDSLELGISAANEETVLYVDNIKVSEFSL